jgi:serine/threonine protein phosphatase PrpC
MELEFWATTDVGRVRDHNEDNFLVDKRLRLFVVCDGMGGHAAGEVASAMSVKVVREVVSESKELFEVLERDPDNLANRKAVQDLCEHAIQQASLRTWQAAQEDPAKRGMGTTCSILLLQDGRGFIGHVGDSRIYLRRQGQIHQITEDHSLLNEMLRLGKLKKGEEHLLPNKNAVTRAVGVNEFVEVDTFEFDVFSGDQFLLCSDGLCGYFKSDDDIMGLLESPDVKEATEQCIAFANAGGGKDNITSIIIRVSGDVGRHRDIQKTIESLKSVPFFQYLAYKELVQVVNLSQRVEFPSHTQICDLRNPSRALYVLVDGLVEVSDADGTRSIGGGGFFGETSIIDESSLPLDAIAVEDTVALKLDADRFMELLRHDSELAVKVLWNFLHNFTIRLRTAEVRTKDSEPSEATPARGTLVFEDDLKHGSLLDADRTLDIDTEHLRSLSAFDSPSSKGKQIVVSEEEVLDGDVTQIPTMRGLGPVAKTPAARPAALSTEDLDWEGIDALLHDDVAEDDLRRTVRIDGFSDNEKTMPSMDATVEKKGFSGISGESVSKSSAPKAQVFKRNKHVPDGEPPTAEEESTLAVRLREKREALKKNVEDVS